MPIKIILFFVFFSGTEFANAQVKDTSYSKSWRDAYIIIDSSFNHTIGDTGTVIEQTAIAVLTLTDGKVDTFNIWSIYEKDKSNWLASFLKPLVNKYFPGFLPYQYVIIPLRVYDNRIDDERIVSKDELFIRSFVGAFKHQAKHTTVITQGVVLSPPWISHRERKRIY